MSKVNRIGLFRGEGFQDFCSVLLSADDKQFQAVDGAGGDLGSDGFRVVGDTIYQAYGPERRDAGKLKKKIDDSIAKALDLRSSSFPRLARLVFLTPFDLTIEQHQYLQQQANSGSLKAESWGESKLLATLSKHRQVKNEFSEILLPDIVSEIRRLRRAKSLRPAQVWPELEVLQKPEHPDVHSQQKAYEYWSLMVQSKALRTPSIEPDDEDSFLERIRERFLDDVGAGFERRDAEHLLVENGQPDYSFHRRWGWWRSGYVGMAATLRDLHRPGVYSAADMVVDVINVLRLASLIGGAGRAKLRFGYDPRTLRIEFDPSDVRAREMLRARLGGVQVVARPTLTETNFPYVLEYPCTLEELASDAHLIAAQVVVPAIRQWHLARIDTAAFAASIPDLVEAERTARAM